MKKQVIATSLILTSLISLNANDLNLSEEEQNLIKQAETSQNQINTDELMPDIKELKGDTKLACEAVLCLSSGVRPGECTPSLKRYFGISFKKWGDTVRGRQNFLNQCPVSSQSPEMKNQIQLLSQLSGQCSVNELNARQEQRLIDKIVTRDKDGNEYTQNIYAYRTHTQLTPNCKIAQQLNYTDYNLKYTCPVEFYHQDDWNRGYIRSEVSYDEFQALPSDKKEQDYNYTPISYNEYIKLPASERYSKKGQGMNYTYYRKYMAYFQKNDINKQCWVNLK